MDKAQKKQQAIKEYLAGGISSLNLGLKYGYGNVTVWRWVMAEKKEKEKLALLHQAKVAADQMAEMPSEVKKLREELRDSRLKVSLLEAMIDISDEQFGTDIRKKAGTRPS